MNTPQPEIASGNISYDYGKPSPAAQEIDFFESPKNEKNRKSGKNHLKI